MGFNLDARFRWIVEMEGAIVLKTNQLIVPILAITQHFLEQSPSRIAHRGRRLQFFQIGFEKMVGDDQRLDCLASIAATGRDCLIGAASSSCAASESAVCDSPITDS
jgi:hypothetical protein